MKKALLLAVSLIAVGCSEAKEYEVTGELTSAVAVDGPIVVEFFEIDKADAEAERESILAVTLTEIGPIAETVEADPELAIIAVAIADADGNGACTEGELWGEVELQKNTADDTVKAFSLALEAQACPVATGSD